jgi:RNA-binding protein YlmH
MTIWSIGEDLGFNTRHRGRLIRTGRVKVNGKTSRDHTAELVKGDVVSYYGQADVTVA